MGKLFFELLVGFILILFVITQVVVPMLTDYKFFWFFRRPEKKKPSKRGNGDSEYI